MRLEATLSTLRGCSLLDFLYLPSHLTVSRREEITRKFGDKARRREREFEVLCDVLAAQIEAGLFRLLDFRVIQVIKAIELRENPEEMKRH